MAIILTAVCSVAFFTVYGVASAGEDLFRSVRDWRRSR